MCAPRTEEGTDTGVFVFEAFPVSPSGAHDRPISCSPSFFLAALSSALWPLKAHVALMAAEGSFCQPHPDGWNASAAISQDSWRSAACWSSDDHTNLTWNHWRVGAEGHLLLFTCVRCPWAGTVQTQLLTREAWLHDHEMGPHLHCRHSSVNEGHRPPRA